MRSPRYEPDDEFGASRSDPISQPAALLQPHPRIVSRPIDRQADTDRRHVVIKKEGAADRKPDSKIAEVANREKGIRDAATLERFDRCDGYSGERAPP